MKLGTANIKVDLYRLVIECVERGVSSGYYKAHKYVDTPDGGTLKNTIVDSVIDELCEYITFSDPVE